MRMQNGRRGNGSKYIQLNRIWKRCSANGFHSRNEILQFNFSAELNFASKTSCGMKFNPGENEDLVTLYTN